MVNALCETDQVVLLDMPELYVYALHGSNTWDEEHADKIWDRASDIITRAADYDAAFLNLFSAYALGPYRSAFQELSRFGGSEQPS